MVEFIGFFISLSALIFLFFQSRAAARRRGDLDGLQEGKMSENNPLHELVKALDKEAGKSVVSTRSNSLPHPKAQANPIHVVNKLKKVSVSSLEGHRFQTEIEKRHLQSSIQTRHLTSCVEKRQSLEQPKESKEVQSLPNYKCLSNLKQMVIHYEIFNRPKGL